MSEERGKRDDRSEDSSTSDLSASGDAAVPTGDTVPANALRPSGKRTARRSRTAAASGDSASAEKVSVTKAPGIKSSGIKSSATKSSVATREKTREPKKMNIFKRLRKFLREVIAELRKVIWPNKKQMVTYTSVVLVFVAFMVAFISGLDLGFTQGVEWLFG